MEFSLMSVLMVVGPILLGLFIHWFMPHKRANWNHRSGRKIMYILGSGGHTTEMLKLAVNGYKHGFHPMVYVAADNDPLSLQKARALDWVRRVTRVTTAEYDQVTRLRNVGENLLWALFRFPRIFAQSWNLMLKHRPDYIMCNGPAICVPITMATEFLRAFRILDCEIVFVESVCRTHNLSYTGHFVVYFADTFVVQWKNLQRAAQRMYYTRDIKYFGRLT